MPACARYLIPEVIAQLQREIQEADGSEIFAVLSRAPGQGKDSLYVEVQVVCRGTHAEVPALVSRTKPGDMTLHNHPSGVLQPSQADLNMATLFGEEGVGSMIVDNHVKNCRVVVEPSEEPAPVDVDETIVRRLFAEDGPLASQLGNYEPRQSQVEMSARVAQTLNRGEILAVEAGTGTGKSLAYLVPSLLWVKENKGRVVIATKTIALQEQLINKDIPIARKIVPDAPRAALVKGRNNYICLRKLNDVKDNQLDLFESSEQGLKNEIRQLAEWVEHGNGGDRADLPFLPSREAWDHVRSDADMCLGSKCPFFQKAPFYESRRQAAQAKILVVNQALLFADLAMRSISGDYKAAAVIPPYRHIVLDEAHSIEDIATDHFGEKISSFGLRLTLGRFLSTGKSNRGILHRLFQAAIEGKRTQLFSKMEEDLLPRFSVAQGEVINQLYALSRALHAVFNQENRRQQVVWLKRDMLQSGRLDDARAEAKELMSLLFNLLILARKIREAAADQPEAFLEKMRGLFIEFDARLSRLENTLSALKKFAIEPGENEVPWLELKRNRNYEEFDYRISPLDVSVMLREALFKPFKSIVMTSATLDLGDGYKFLASRNGLAGWEERPWSFVGFPSPFDFQQQARLLLPRMPTNPNSQGFLHDLADLILATTLAEHPGGTLVLFTAYSMLNRIADMLAGPLARAGIVLLVQGTASRGDLVARLKQSHGVLLGTDSFWEGIDLPGEALTKVIIAKLPFRQIGDPIFAARCTAIEATGGSSFQKLSLPIALLKFKQGAGRLIRHRSDRGVLIVADNRVRQKGYGRKFLALVNTYPQWELDPQQVARALREEEETV
jgi:ATP-dependent DNA helicase DinG